ncbi:MAG: GtrA family protein [Bacteroidales bacterium]|jgi:putative flippase GtrA|nr:GtrA family protein [Bacteroidales bacterium]MBQ1906417.1 GtrA family protein [Bacteroidales bacterium]MBQ2104659.1 GtrA family protein [Bacteroidales bacterium]MBQ2502060.1 GtrA family protein [Bacteroidales bacterium]MBQ3984828.1 GtrA family protein [Bacteroidales bacterium]
MGFVDTLKRLAKHTLFSLLGTATDTLVLWFLSSLVFKSYVGEYIISPIISFECATLVNFLSSSKLVWKDRMKGLSLGSYFKHFLGFNASYAGVFLLKMALLLGLERLSGWDVVWCNLIAVTICGFINFFMNEKVIFRPKS